MNKIFQSAEITVICTLYKRPESLIKQLEAINNQTYKPKKIMLFQDGIADYYRIEMLESLKSKFDDIRVSDVNMGVWERFRYACETDTEYVCLFDDDTIPGEKWFENCIDQMKIREGIYGTNGIVMTDNHTYPKGGYFPVGWKGPVSKCTEVDFVGHAWFLKTEWLKWMFDGTEELQKLKYAAEDMCISAKAKQHGIRTFVPPHPVEDKTLWGSSPVFGNKFGNAVEALSFSMDNLDRMQNALKTLQSMGWSPLCISEKEKVLVAKKNRKKEDNVILKRVIKSAINRRMRR